MQSITNAQSARGIKRKADVTHPDAPKRIKPLRQDVVNKIAAGEIIVAPMHALKEMVENSVDAGSTSIEIIVKDGGLKLLQISDNGHGIHFDDLPLLCERFTTSKLQLFDDLSRLTTYGFRGEALASISHVAHLKVTTRTAESSCAYQSHFKDGKLIPIKPNGDPKPKPIAGRIGTQITVEDLFYNVPQRRKTFRSSSEEYAKILDMVGKYSIHCRGVAFTCKKQNDNSLGLSVSAIQSTAEAIGTVYGMAVSKALMHCETKDEKLAFSASGYVSNANYHAKKTTLLLFINNRAVESHAIKVSVQRLYSAFLPKGSFPFVYLSIEISPERVDVNVHPTKQEVGFLNEEEIIDALCMCIREALSSADESRTFMTQSILPMVENDSRTSKAQESIASRPLIRSTDNNLVRTDPKARKITTMMANGATRQGAESDYVVLNRMYTQVRLTSVRELRTAVHLQLHQGLSDLFSAHTWVGVIDTQRRVAAIQAGVRMYLIDYGRVACELFYQIGLSNFGNFSTISFDNPLDLRLLVKTAADVEYQTNSAIDPNATAERITALLIERRDMLLEYFAMEVTLEGKLSSLPLLLKHYTPCFAKLPRFLLRLGPCVDWTQEKECFQTFLAELAAFYVPEQLRPRDASEPREARTDENIDSRQEHVYHALEHVVFPAFKSQLIPTKGLLPGVLEIADLKGLYRVFERC